MMTKKKKMLFEVMMTKKKKMLFEVMMTKKIKNVVRGDDKKKVL